MTAGTDGGMIELARDERWIAVFKPSGVLVHRGWARDGVIATDVVRRWLDGPAFPVHRLDRATSGVLLFARDKDAARSLQQAFQACTVRKGYLALVRGQPAAEFRCDYALRRGRSQRATAQERVPALTRFSRLWTGDGPLHCYSLVAARPETGRMHQIRRHLKHLSHPIIGDVKYGKGRQNRWFRAEMGLHRLALHACRLAFPDPDSEQSVVVYAPVPDDLGAPLVKFGVPPELLAKICADHSVWDAGRDINDVP